MKELISVVIPAKNAEKTIAKTLNSVFKQSYENFEIIVVDDGSTDKTKEILNSFKDKKIKLIRNEKSFGPAVSRNKGIREAKGSIVFFTDADCYVPKNWIEKILKEYDEKIAGVGGWLKPQKNNWVAKLEMFQNRFLLGIKNEKIIGKAKTPMGYTNNVSYRKKVLEEIGGFDEKFPSPAGEDIDLKRRICKKGYRVVFLPLPVIHLENYDLDYFLRRVIVKGLDKELPKNKFLKVFYVLFMLPLALFKIARKVIGYKIGGLV